MPNLDLGTADLRTSFIFPYSPPLQDSLNLGFGGLNGNFNFGYVASPPVGLSFNPNADGEYSFALIAIKGNAELGRTEMLVNAVPVNAVPEPATMIMFSMLAVGAAGAYRRRTKRAAAC